MLLRTTIVVLSAVFLLTSIAKADGPAPVKKDPLLEATIQRLNDEVDAAVKSAQATAGNKRAKVLKAAKAYLDEAEIKYKDDDDVFVKLEEQRTALAKKVSDLETRRTTAQRVFDLAETEWDKVPDADKDKP